MATKKKKSNVTPMTAAPSTTSTESSEERHPEHHRPPGDGARMLSRLELEAAIGKDVHDENIRKAKEIRARKQD
jgi:hypothetical protein